MSDFQEVTKNGHRFTVDISDVGVYWKHMESGEWEPYTYNIMDKYVTKDTTYIDLGAWIGVTALYAAKLCNVCYALEPDHVAYAQLIKNISASNITNIVALNEAILNYNGTLTLGNENPKLGNSISRIGESNNIFQVKCSTLDTFVSKYNLNNPMFIKMDVEAAEEFILKDTAFFEKWHPTLYLSIHQQWFKNFNEGMRVIKEVSKLYKKCLDENLNELIINDACKNLVLSDK
jgi:FkbM family methyltransferase